MPILLDLIDFKEEVFESETKYEEKIKVFEGTIVKSNKQLLELIKINVSFEDELVKNGKKDGCVWGGNCRIK